MPASPTAAVCGFALEARRGRSAPVTAASVGFAACPYTLCSIYQGGDPGRGLAVALLCDNAEEYSHAGISLTRLYTWSEDVICIQR